MTIGAVPRRIREMVVGPFDALNSRAAELRAAGRDVISLGQAIPPFGPPPPALAAAAAALADGDAHVYSPDAGRRSLREALAWRLTGEGAAVQPDQLVITAGANQAFMLLMATLLEPGDEVLLVAPFFANHETAIRALSGRPVEVPTGATFAPTWDAIADQVTARTRVAVLCNPNNPTGAVAAPAELGRIADQLRDRGVTLVVDETYQHFVYPPAVHRSIASLDRWTDGLMAVGSFSKSFGMTGWRLGYLLASEAVCAEAIKIHDAMVICAPVISQIAGEAALRDAWTYPRDAHPALLASRAAFLGAVRELPGIQVEVTDAGFFFLARVDGARDSAVLAADILERVGVVTIPGTPFGASAEGHLRLSYGSLSPAAVSAAIGRLADYFSRTPAITPSA